MATLNGRIDHCHQDLDAVLEGVLRLLSDKLVMPYHVLHVEHCFDCQAHQLTTRHVPGSYEKAFEDLRDELKRHLPPTLIYSNLRLVMKAPRVGSFEVAVRPFGSSKSLVVYSKLRKKSFPKPNEIIEELSCLLLPEVIHFSSVTPVLDVLVFDAYSKKPIEGAHVYLTRISTTVTNPHEPLENVDAMLTVAAGTAHAIHEDVQDVAVEQDRALAAADALGRRDVEAQLRGQQEKEEDDGGGFVFIRYEDRRTELEKEMEQEKTVLKKPKKKRDGGSRDDDDDDSDDEDNEDDASKESAELEPVHRSDGKNSSYHNGTIGNHFHQAKSQESKKSSVFISDPFNEFSNHAIQLDSSLLDAAESPSARRRPVVLSSHSHLSLDKAHLSDNIAMASLSPQGQHRAASPPPTASSGRFVFILHRLW